MGLHGSRCSIAGRIFLLKMYEYRIPLANVASILIQLAVKWSALTHIVVVTSLSHCIVRRGKLTGNNEQHIHNRSSKFLPLFRGAFFFFHFAASNKVSRSLCMFCLQHPPLAIAISVQQGIFIFVFFLSRAAHLLWVQYSTSRRQTLWMWLKLNKQSNKIFKEAFQGWRPTTIWILQPSK